MADISSPHLTQLHLYVPLSDIQATGAVPKAMAAVAPHCPRHAVLTSGSAGIRVVVGNPHGWDLQRAAAEHSSLVSVLAEQAIVLDTAQVHTTLVEPSEPAFVDLAAFHVVDAVVLGQFAAWVRGWEFAAIPALPATVRVLAPSAVLARYSHVASLVVGALAWTGSVPTSSLLASWADEERMPGEWQLVTSAAATAAASCGYSAIFEPGEMVDVTLTASASLAVASAATRELARRTQVSEMAVVDALASAGPNADLLGSLIHRS